MQRQRRSPNRYEYTYIYIYIYTYIYIYIYMCIVWIYIHMYIHITHIYIGVLVTSMPFHDEMVLRVMGEIERGAKFNHVSPIQEKMTFFWFFYCAGWSDMENNEIDRNRAPSSKNHVYLRRSLGPRKFFFRSWNMRKKKGHKY
jgi:hypothetical protein